MPTLPELVMMNAVVVAVAVDEATAKSGCLAVSAVELLMESLAYGEVVPIPTFAEASIVIPSDA